MRNTQRDSESLQHQDQLIQINPTYTKRRRESQSPPPVPEYLEIYVEEIPMIILGLSNINMSSIQKKNNT